MRLLNVLRSIKFQILFVLITLIILIIVQVILSRNDQVTFNQGFKLKQLAIEQVNLVGVLGKEVVDLQRIVLIYKQTARRSVINKFDKLMKKLNEDLSLLSNKTSSKKNASQYDDYITRMFEHLKDYDINFKNVVKSRQRRELLFEKGLIVDLNQLEETISVYYKTSQNKSEKLQLNLYISQIHAIAAQYMLTFDYLQKDLFQKKIVQTKRLINDLVIAQYKKDDLLKKIVKISQSFTSLTRTTRNYSELVNVVMTGSANEFIYLTQELNTLVTKQLEHTESTINLSLTVAKLRNTISAAVAIFLALIIAIFMTYRIIEPINRITKIFTILSRDEHVDKIPELERKDEIGMLAQAANIFHSKNKQTFDLLLDARKLNEKQVQLNNELEASKVLAEQASKSKSMFLANMSHEIRTPMNGISGLVDVLLESNLTHSQREDLEKVSYSTKILMYVINDILDFSKIEAGKLDVEHVDFKVNELFENILSNISILTKDKQLIFRFNASHNIPKILYGDPIRISQVLMNLCTNAVKFTETGTIELNVSIKYSDLPDYCELFCEVTDTGIGMTQAQQSKVFESFTQADGSTSRKFGGTGLGLSIVQQLVKLMGGQVQLSSKPDQGSQFTVNFKLGVKNNATSIYDNLQNNKIKIYYLTDPKNTIITQTCLAALSHCINVISYSQLPQIIDNLENRSIVLVDLDSRTIEKSLEKIQGKINDKNIVIGHITDNILNFERHDTFHYLFTPFTPNGLAKFITQLHQSIQSTSQEKQLDINQKQQFNGHVLLVEDNPINRVVAAKILTSFGLSFDFVVDGSEAVKKVDSDNTYDLIFMDVQMPVMDGYTATNIIREKGFNKLIICGLSANAMKEDTTLAFEAGMNDYLTKPIQIKKMKEILTKYLNFKL